MCSELSTVYAISPQSSRQLRPIVRGVLDLIFCTNHLLEPMHFCIHLYQVVPLHGTNLLTNRQQQAVYRLLRGYYNEFYFLYINILYTVIIILLYTVIVSLLIILSVYPLFYSLFVCLWVCTRLALVLLLLYIHCIFNARIIIDKKKQKKNKQTKLSKHNLKW